MERCKEGVKQGSEEGRRKATIVEQEKRRKEERQETKVGKKETIETQKGKGTGGSKTASTESTKESQRGGHKVICCGLTSQSAGHLPLHVILDTTVFFGLATVLFACWDLFTLVDSENPTVE